MKKPLILFGKGSFAQIAKDYFNNDSIYEVIAFTIDDEYIESEEYEGLPIIPFSKIEKLYPPEIFTMYIALVYTEMNKLREKKYFKAKNKGYKLANYISSKCSFLSNIATGDNCFIFEDNTIQPYVKIENNVILWSGNHIGHHSIIESHNFISSHVVISGHCKIKPNCFIGVNSTIAHKITIEKESLIGAGAIISTDTDAKGVYLPPKSIKINKTSNEIKL
jgi:sugar O-acyltransferase (sialic acid O-acetyltransferase NeuD family)